jgi:restriction system protein
MAPRSYYYIDISHSGLNKYRRIKGADKWVVEQMAAKQQALWDEQWTKKQQAESKRDAREAAAMQKEAQKETALERTQEAQEALQEIENLLKHALDEGVTFKWRSLIKADPFPEPQPTQLSPQAVPPKPNAANPAFLPKLTLFDHFVSSWKLKKVEDARQHFNAAVRQWEVNAKAIGDGNAASEETHRQKLAEWQVRKAEFLHSQNLYNACVEARKIAYEEKQVDAVTEYCERVLSASSYPDCFSGDWELEYRQVNGVRLRYLGIDSPPLSG